MKNVTLILTTAIFLLFLSACSDPKVSALETHIEKHEEIADKYLKLLNSKNFDKSSICSNQNKEAKKTLEAYTQEYIGAENSPINKAQSIKIDDSDVKQALVDRAKRAKAKLAEAYNELSNALYYNNCY